MDEMALVIGCATCSMNEVAISVEICWFQVVLQKTIQRVWYGIQIPKRSSRMGRHKTQGTQELS